MEKLTRDLRFAIKTWRRNPAITAAAILSLGLGIGAVTAVFSLVNGILLSPLPYEDPDELCVVWNHFPRQSRARTPVSGWEFLDLQGEGRTFEEVGGVILWTFNLTDTEPAQRVLGARASASLFRLLGTEPLLGRVYSEEEQERGDPVMVLSHGLWQRAFGGDSEVVGRSVSVGPIPYTVIGVMREDRRPVPYEAELWVPLVPNPAVPRDVRGVLAIARLADGVGLERAQADLDHLARRLIQDYPEVYSADDGWGLLPEPLVDLVVGRVRGRLTALLGAVALVLLIACANVANLLLAQAAGRQKEMALRAALGAGRPALLRQLLTESVALAAVAGALGLMLAYWGLRLAVAVRLGDLPRLDEVAVDSRVLLFALGVSLGTGILFGLAPAVMTWRTDLRQAIHAGGKTASMARRHPLRSVLVVAEIALALAVLYGSGLMLESFRGLQKVDPGFRPEGVVTMQIRLLPRKYAADADRVGFYRQLRERLTALPGVGSAGIISQLPLSKSRQAGPILAEGADPEVRGPAVGWRMVSPEVFETLGLRLLKGRVTTDLDREDTVPVVVVDKNTAQRLWPDRDPIGQRLQLLSTPPSAWLTVVGVVDAVRQRGLEVEDFEQLYLPFPQLPSDELGIALLGAEGTELDLARTAAVVREAVAAIDRQQPVTDAQTLEQMVADALTGPRFNLVAFSLFGALAFVLAAVGIYGVMASSVVERTGELGVRRALGASALDVLGLVLGAGMRLATFGVVLGLGLSLLLVHLFSRLIAGLVHGVEVVDVATYVVVTLGLLLTAFAGSLLPALRAARVDPVVALRQE